jgi:PD-(D/E)XK endonuclease
MGKADSRGSIPGYVPRSARKAMRGDGIWTNEQGDLGEAAFVYKAMSVGLVVAKPNGQNHRYDFMVDGGKGLWRVQVKASSHLIWGSYHASISRRKNGIKVAYTESELDFVVVLIVPEQTWYVLPVRVVVGRMALMIRSQNGVHHRDPYAYYREAWHLLREPDGLTFG